jgi:hypothetical protein
MAREAVMRRVAKVNPSLLSFFLRAIDRERETLLLDAGVENFRLQFAIPNVLSTFVVLFSLLTFLPRRD